MKIRIIVYLLDSISEIEAKTIYGLLNKNNKRQYVVLNFYIFAPFIYMVQGRDTFELFKSAVLSNNLYSLFFFRLPRDISEVCFIQHYHLYQAYEK